MKNKKIVIISAIVLLALFIVGGNVYKNKQAEELAAIAKKNALVLQRDYSIVIGNKDAKVQLVEFFDPACGTCASFHPHVKDIMKQNEGKIKLVLRYAPFHSGSDYAVKMLEGARLQGKFMQTLELMFDTQQHWIRDHVGNPNILWKILPQAGLDMQKLFEDMKDPKFDEIIRQDLADAKKLNASKTPSYFVNGKPLITFGLDQLKELINSEL